jgi:hypothetical protein
MNLLLIDNLSLDIPLFTLFIQFFLKYFLQLSHSGKKVGGVRIRKRFYTLLLGERV